MNADYVKSELYGFIESFIMRRLVTKATTKNYNQLFTDRLIFNRILSKREFLEFLEKQDDKVNYLPNDIQMQEAIDYYVLTNKQAAGVLYLIAMAVMALPEPCRKRLRRSLHENGYKDSLSC